MYKKKRKSTAKKRPAMYKRGYAAGYSKGRRAKRKR